MPYLKNFMEEIVLNQMKTVLRDVDICQCEKCRLDVAAIALTDLPARYVVTDKGILFSRIDSLYQQSEIEVTSAIMRAVQIVQKKPLHDKSQDVIKE